MFETCGEYTIVARVGVGGVGDLFRGRDARRGRTVAIEATPASLGADADRRAGFVREAQASMVLSHPSIAPLHEIVDDHGCLFLVFDVAPGQTLQAAIGTQPMNTRRALDIALEIADALAEAHAHDVFHRRLTPASVIVTLKGNAKVIDFGLSVWTDGGRPDARPYMSPEQLRGDLVDERSDTFSLGIVLFEMLAGAPPPARRSLPRELEGIVAKATARDVDARYQSAAAFAADLREIAGLLEARRAAGERGVI